MTGNGSGRQLTLPDELVLMLLNEENGYFYQVPGWRLHCAIIGAALAELSLQSRIDTDLDSLFLVDDAETGDPVLDPILEEVAGASERRNAQYWIERLAPRAESIVDMILDRLVDLEILEHHDGEFWTLARSAWQPDAHGRPQEATLGQFIRTRISKLIFTDSIPDPRDVIIICLVNTCDVFRFMFSLDEAAEERIEFICQLDLIGRSMAEAVLHNVTSPTRRQSRFTKRIPTLGLRDLVRTGHLRDGNLPAMIASLVKEHGHVFKIKPPFAKPMIVMAGANINHWVNRHGRMYLRARDYFVDFEQAFGASGVLPSLDGADHFRLRKAMAPAYSRRRLQAQADTLFKYVRNFIGDWKVGDTFPARTTLRRLFNNQISPLSISVESQDLYDDLVTWKERALAVCIARSMPKISMKTPSMRRKEKAFEDLLRRVESVYTPAQRAGCPRTLGDDVLSLNASDPQLVPESNLRFALTNSLIVSVYLGDELGFVLYNMATRPELTAKIREEAEALFGDGDPSGDDFTPGALDVTQRFFSECLRLYPIVPMSVRNVMNSCVVEGYELPVGERIHIAHVAAHYMEDVFPDPFKFDIDRYLAPRYEHRGPGYAPYGVGTHRCLGFRWMELQMLVNMLLIAHHFRLEVHPSNLKFRINPFPALKPTGKLSFRVAEQYREVSV